MKRFAYLISLSLALTLSACTPNTLNNGATIPDSLDNSQITPRPKGPDMLIPQEGLPGLTSPQIPTLDSIDAAAGSSAQKSQPLTEAELAPSLPTHSDGGAYSGEDGSVTPVADIAILPPRDDSDEAEEDQEQATAEPQPSQQNFFYFSYDDSASTAGVKLTHSALLNNRFINPDWVRPWEFLNYASFQKNSTENLGIFDVSMGLLAHPAQDESASEHYDLGVSVYSPEIDKSSRKNLVITLVVDTSGSMRSPTISLGQEDTTPSLMALAHSGLKQMLSALKPGDIINLVAFNNQTHILLDGFEFTESSDQELISAIEALQASGGTNLSEGMDAAYNLAQKHYDSNKSNRVIMLTDAFANRGVIDPQEVSKYTEINQSEGILFSGLGFGQDFNEGFLNDLTEAGRGAYYAIVTQEDAQRAFGERFMALVNIAAKDVSFRLDYPQNLKHTDSSSEESSQVQSEVQPVNFSYNTSQYFYERFSASTSLEDDAEFKLTIEYTDPSSGEKKTESISKSVADILNREVSNIRDAHLITLLTDFLLGEIDASTLKAQMALHSSHSSSIADTYRQLIEKALEQGQSEPVEPILFEDETVDAP